MFRRVRPRWNRFLQIALPLALLSAAPAAAARDWNRTDDPMLDAVGLHAGKIGGVGLAFKMPLQWWLYGQVAGGIWHTADDKRHNVGFELQYLMRQDRSLRVFFSGGVAYFYHKDRQDSVDGREVFETKRGWNAGFGVGVEMLRSERVSVQVEADFTHDSHDDSITVFPQAGLYFYF